MRKSKANGNQKAKVKSRVRGNARNNGDAVAELCDIIESTFARIQTFETAAGFSSSTALNLFGCMEKVTLTLHSDYKEDERRYETLMAELGKKLSGSKFVTTDGLEDTMMSMRVVEKEAWFAVGVLFGKKSAGSPMEEIKKLASSIVARG